MTQPWHPVTFCVYLDDTFLNWASVYSHCTEPEKNAHADAIGQQLNALDRYITIHEQSSW